MIKTHQRLIPVLVSLASFWASSTAAHPVHTHADSVDGEAMGAVVAEYHSLLSAADSTAPERYENHVEVVHVLARWNRGIVLTHEVGSCRDGTWDSYNAWILMRVDDQWRIGASIHGLPAELRTQLEEENYKE